MKWAVRLTVEQIAEATPLPVDVGTLRGLDGRISGWDLGHLCLPDDDGLEEAMDALAPEIRHLFEDVLMEGEWFPAMPPPEEAP